MARLYSTLLAACFLGTALAVPKSGHRVTAALSAEPLEAADSNVHYPEEYRVESTYDENTEEASNDFADVISGSAIVTPVAPFPADVPRVPGKEWKRIGYLDMTDPTQQCFSAWKKYNSPRAACGRSNLAGGCDSVLLPASGYNYDSICGRFRGYQVGTPDGFVNGGGIEGPYVDGISLTYGPAGARKHLFTYALGWSELQTAPNACPCAGGPAAQAFVGTSYHCESGNPGPTYSLGSMYSQDPLWDGQQCGGTEGPCCSDPNLAWFCTQLAAPISSDLEVRICFDEAYNNEDVAIEFLEVFVK